MRAEPEPFDCFVIRRESPMNTDARKIVHLFRRLDSMFETQARFANEADLVMAEAKRFLRTLPDLIDGEDGFL